MVIRSLWLVLAGALAAGDARARRERAPASAPVPPAAALMVTLDLQGGLADAERLRAAIAAAR
jgi:hypothetical protein